MIFDALFAPLFTLIMTMFGFFPSFPATPNEVSTVGSFLADLIGQPIGIMFYIFGEAYTLVIFALTIAFLLFDQIYHMSMFVIKKVPLINVR